VSEHLQREDLLPAHVIRQMRRQEAVLLHGTLPPIHLRAVRWWDDKTLAALVPKGADGKPVGPPATGTCPTREGPRGPVAPVLDPAVLEESVSHLPRPRDAAPAQQVPRSRPSTRPAAPGQARLPLDAPRERDHGAADRNRVERVGTREVVRCDPACPPDSAH
jgi:type IV secretion system protein VirD4